MDEQKQTYEQFKADILQWKDAHREEYRRFAKKLVASFLNHLRREGSVVFDFF